MMLLTSQEGGSGGVEEGMGGSVVMEGDSTWGGQHIIQYTDDVLQSRIAETYVIVLTNVTPLNSTEKQ